MCLWDVLMMNHPQYVELQRNIVKGKEMQLYDLKQDINIHVCLRMNVHFVSQQQPSTAMEQWNKNQPVQKKKVPFVVAPIYSSLWHF